MLADQLWWGLLVEGIGWARLKEWDCRWGKGGGCGGHWQHFARG